jgi:hypothetical protein
MTYRQAQGLGAHLRIAQEAVDWLAATTIIDSGAAKAPVERGDAALPKEVLGPFAFARGVLSRG